MQLVMRRQQRGAEISAACLSEALAAKGHEVHFVGLYAAPDTDILIPNACTCHDLHGNKTNAFSFSRLRQLQDLVRKLQPDVLQANGSDTLKYAVMLKVLYFPKLPVVYRLISIPSYWIGSNPLKRQFYQWLYHQLDHVVGVGQQAINDLQSLLGVPTQKSSVIYRGIIGKSFERKHERKEIIEKLGLAEETMLIVSAGALSPEKDHAFMLEAAKILKEKGGLHFQLLLLGEGKEREALESRCQALDLGTHVQLPGHQSPLGAWLAAADVFWLTSKIEGVPGVIMEAAMQGTPAIALDVGGVSEVVQHGETGLLLQDRDPNAFAKLSLDLLQDEEQRKSLGIKAKALAMQKFDLEKSASAFEQLYVQLNRAQKQ
jgi:glycosyltransferase involved in cell wall biosynthesis